MSTFTDYQLIAKDLPAALSRKASEAVTARETAYFKANIGKVTSVDQFLSNQRLYAYAMKAYGLEEMTYAKAFMRKVLEGGTSDSAALANRLADARYVAFAKAFDFSPSGGRAAGSDAGASYAITTGADGRLVQTRTDTPARAAQVTGSVSLYDFVDFSGANEVNLTVTTSLDARTTRTATIVLNREVLSGQAVNLAKVTGAEMLRAIQAQIDASDLKGTLAVSLAAGGGLTLTSTAYTDLGSDQAAGGVGGNADTAYAGTGPQRVVTVAPNAPGAGKIAYNLGFGTALSPAAGARATVDAYLQQTLETDAGGESTALRLALYFARVAPTVSTAYQVLADPALTQVVKTLLNLPNSGSSSADALERTAATIKARLDLASFKDPVKLGRLVQRFTAIWDAQNAATSAPVLGLFTGGAALGADTLLSLQQIRRRG